jgi:hypothetical protein
MQMHHYKHYLDGIYIGEVYLENPGKMSAPQARSIFALATLGGSYLCLVAQGTQTLD